MKFSGELLPKEELMQQLGLVLEGVVVACFRGSFFGSSRAECSKVASSTIRSMREYPNHELQSFDGSRQEACR